MTDLPPSESSRSPQSSQIAAVGSLVAARDLEELVLAAALIPAQLLSARETIVALRATDAEIIQRQPSSVSSELEAWATGLTHLSGEAVREGSWFAVGTEPVDGWSGVIAVSLVAPDEETARGLSELGRIVSRCVAQIASLKRRDTALEDARKSIGKGLHDLRTPLNSLRLGLHLLQPGLAGQDPQVVQRTHRAVDRLAALVTEMYEALHEKTGTR
jgi:signal transduction histidine kinase